MKNIQRLWVVTALFVLAGCAATSTKTSTDRAAQCCAAVESGGALHGGTAIAAKQSADGVESSRGAFTPGQPKISDGAGDVVVQTVEFRSGVSSATVERLAKHFGCTGTMGAGLVTDKGPIEVYRMKCDNGTTFMARCELRQCRPMR